MSTINIKCKNAILSFVKNYKNYTFTNQGTEAGSKFTDIKGVEVSSTAGVNYYPTLPTGTTVKIKVDYEGAFSGDVVVEGVVGLNKVTVSGLPTLNTNTRSAEFSMPSGADSIRIKTKASNGVVITTSIPIQYAD